MTLNATLRDLEELQLTPGDEVQIQGGGTTIDGLTYFGKGSTTL
jgi:hypothetical protein